MYIFFNSNVQEIDICDKKYFTKKHSNKLGVSYQTNLEGGHGPPVGNHYFIPQSPDNYYLYL